MRTPRSSTSTLPPDYVHLSEAPAYSVEPYSSERRLAFTPRYPHQASQNGTVIRRGKGISVVLSNQAEDAPVPSYVQRERVQGEVILAKTEKLTQVSVQLQARVVLNVSEGGKSVCTVFSRQCTLWNANDAGCEACPLTLAFSLGFPSAWREGERTRTLPPSYEVDFPGVPGMSAQFAYVLAVSVVAKAGLLTPWRRRPTFFNIPLEYQFRTRPGCPPIPRNFSFLSSFKTIPEEWFQVISTMPTRWKTGVQPIECHLYIPSVQVFAFSDIIPFHLQLRAPVPSLRAFLIGGPHLEQRPSRKQRRSASGGNGAGPGAAASVRVYLYRQITVEVRGQKAWRTCVLGEGVLRSLPPPAEHGDGVLGALDWDGEVRCNEDVKVGGFHAGKLNVKDFIVVHLVPSCPEYSPLLEHHHAHPIRLVTDAFMEEDAAQ